MADSRRTPRCFKRRESPSGQLAVSEQRHPGRSDATQLVLAFPAKLRRQRPVHPYAAANALALEHRDIAKTVAANISRRTGHPREDLEQLAMLGILQAARRYSPERGPFRPFARTYANGEVYHYLRDKGFLIKVPASWRELYARGQKLTRMGIHESEILNKLGVTESRWSEIAAACRVRVVSCAQHQLGEEENGTINQPGLPR